jgi:hypothetical protein
MIKAWKPFRLRTEPSKRGTIQCPECKTGTTVGHLHWSALRCGQCKQMINRDDWINISTERMQISVSGKYLVPSVSDKIQSILDAVNGRSTAHTFNTHRRIFDCMETAEERRQGLGLSKLHSVGMRVKFLSGEPVSSGYKYSRDGTEVVLVYRRSGWYVETITSAQLYPNDGGLVKPILTLGQAKLVLQKFQSDQFRVSGPRLDVAAHLHVDDRGNINVDVDRHQTA